MTIIPWLSYARTVPTDKCSRGRRKPEAIVLHISASPPRDAESDRRRVDRWATDERQSSTHVVIHRDGAIDQMTPFTRRAWHVGKFSCLMGDARDVNQRCIGIDLMNEGPLTDSRTEWYDERERCYEHHGGRAWETIPSAQLSGLVRVVADVRAVFGRPDLPILGHCDVAPTWRPDCPGAAVPWALLRGPI